MPPTSETTHPSDLLRCPLCRGAFTWAGREAVCEQGHRFDRARQGYLNLAVHGKQDKSRSGYDKEMMLRRRQTFERGWYDPMRAGVVAAAAAAHPGGGVLDLGCGEGYYTAAIGAALDADTIGIDLSKHGVAMAAAADKHSSYAVANAYDVPVRDGAIGTAVSVFSPVPPDELSRLLHAGGRVVTAQPATSHLRELKAALYDEPRPFDTRDLLPQTGWDVTAEDVVSTTLDLTADGDLATLVEMTPYAHSSAYRARREDLRCPAVTIAFLVRTWASR